jgi:hypothetical protein
MDMIMDAMRMLPKESEEWEAADKALSNLGKFVRKAHVTPQMQQTQVRDLLQRMAQGRMAPAAMGAMGQMPGQQPQRQPPTPAMPLPGA